MDPRRFARLTARLDTAIEHAAAAILGTGAAFLLVTAIDAAVQVTMRSSSAAVALENTP